jgi:hypothetical protein
MVTKATGKPPGRPRVLLRDNPLRFELALAEVIRRRFKVSGHKARVLAVLELRAKKTDDDEINPRLARIQEKQGGELVFYDISAIGGDPDEGVDLSKRLQVVNSLEKMSKRGLAEEDKEYFEKLATCFFAALFGKGDLVRRAAGIELLSREIGEEGRFARMVAHMRATVASNATRDWPELCPVGGLKNRIHTTAIPGATWPPTW